MNDKFNKFREQYKSIIYKNYKIIEEDNNLKIEFNFIIPNLTEFNPSLTINKNIITNNNISKDILNNIIFNIGLVELISYYKSTCPKKIIIEAGYLDSYQQKWYKKLFYNGLGEFLYLNNINISEDELFEFDIKGEKIDITSNNYQGIGNLIPVGGGKDSCVSLELLKEYKDINKCYIINPKEVTLNCCKVAGYEDKDICTVKRVIDKNLIELNNQGFLNGHTPFSAIVAFTSYLIAYLTNKKYIILSNENSANESTVLNTNINHQYSKTIEFENDFQEYTNKYFKININYFSLLRPLREIQIAKLFTKNNKYFNIFKSCNLGSKNKEWCWCCNCPKCLFVYIILTPFLKHEEIINIFGEDLLDKESLTLTFLQLIGEKETKPFECVGTIEEVIYSLNQYILNNNNLPKLVKLYKDNYYKDIDIDMFEINNEHNLPDEYLEIVRKAINNGK